MEMSGQLHAPSALSPVATEQGGCVSLRTDLNTLEETKIISCLCLESNHDSLGCKCHRHCSIPASHAQDDALRVIFYFTTFTRQKWNNFHTDKPTVYTLTKELGICRQRRCFNTRQASINDNPSVPLRHIYSCTWSAPSRSYTPKHAYRKRAPTETRHSFILFTEK